MWQAQKSMTARRLMVAGSLLGIVAALGLGSSASADQAFHSEQIPLAPLNGAPFHSGFVVDIHANGAEVYALERYQLNGAAPNTTYQVQLLVFLNSTCSGTPLVVPSSSLQTNGSGNGEASNRFGPQQVPAFLRNTVISIIWQVLKGGVVNYQTACTLVVQD